MNILQARRHAHALVTTVLIIIAMLIIPSAFAASPTVDIAGVPLYSGRGNVHPNLLLSLSVEFPTVGVAYRGDGGTYNRTNEYVGYFNPTKCYLYNGGDHDTADTGYFYISKNADATTHECGGGAFSGNFMNWAASSAIDMLRLALTGGDRVIDTPATTVLQRAVLMDTTVENFYANGSYFPRRSVKQGGNVSAPNQVTPFNVTTLYVVSCRNRILFSDSSSGMPKSSSDYGTVSKYCTTGYNKGAPVDKKLGDYLARVLVCDTSEGPSRTDLCKKYGSNYKPVGEIQNKSDGLRLAAMGYLLDNDAARYGGVLRAPMKYVGQKKIDATTFAEAVNDKLEWDPETGVFYSNPEDPANRSSATVNSGVVNYLNKFGRSANYKQYDPISELYYEGIRYLQGKQPTANAIAGMTEAMKDGFPVIDSWSDPVTASCQNNYILTIADVNTHWDRYIPGNNRTWTDQARPKESADNKTPELDVTTWTKIVGDLESNTKNGSNPTPSNPAPRSNLAGMESLDTGSGGHGTYYMAGLAYWANTHNIRLDKPTRVKTFAIDVDEGGNGLIDGNTRSLKPRDSQLYLAAKYGGFNDVNGDGNPFITFDIDGTTVVKGVNKEWDNGNGVPANYFLAGQPKELIQSIRNIFNNISSISGTISGVSVSSIKLVSTDAFVYQPGFNASKWSGSLKKLALSLKEDASVGISTQAEWDAGVILTGVSAAAASPAPDQRRIYTTKVDGNTASAVEFKWTTLSDGQKSLLNASPEDGSRDDLGEKRVNFLRGVRTDELGQANGIFRTRERVLGDIVNGNPVYVGAPATNIQGSGYQTFYDARKGRTPAVYIGANDGMLHAFKASDGKELFAYVPNALIPSVNQLSSPNYTHHSYVDGPLATGEALVGNSWKTVLVSGMGSGAQGLFALDVTAPDTFGAGNVLWEFTDLNDPDMGNVVGAPLIAKFKTGTTNGVPTYKYFAVVSSGLNNYKDDGQNRFNVDAASALFLLALDKSPGQQWQQDVNYFKFRMPSSNADSQNGLGMPALVTDTAGTVLYVYVGDLQGNLWRIDFSAGSLADVSVGTKPLFVAKDGNDARQPITMQPKVVFAPRGGYIVLFGTGKFIENRDAAATGDGFKPQSFYAVYDNKGNIATSLNRSSLVPRTLTKSGGGLAVSGDDFLYGDGGSSSMGWYVDFFDSVHTGERAITNPVLSNGILFFNSLIPGGDPCGSGGGRTYVLNVLTGLVATAGVTGYESQIGMLSSPVVFQAGATVGGRNATGRRMVTKKNSIVNFGTNGAVAAENGVVPVTVSAGRLSWREILNWQEVRNALNN